MKFADGKELEAIKGRMNGAKKAFGADPMTMKKITRMKLKGPSH